MTRNELIEGLNCVLSQGNQLSTVVFAVMKESYEIKKLNIENEELSTIQNMFIASVRNKILNVEEQALMKVSEADNRANTVFHYDLELPSGLAFYSSQLTDSISNFSFSEDDLGNIDSLIIKIGTEQHQIKIYKKLSSVEVLGRGGYLFKKAKTQLERFTEKILNLTSSFNAVFVENTYVFLDLRLLETSHGFHDVIVREASNSVELIQALGILVTTDGIVQLLEKTSFARKVVKIKNSPVILKQIPNAQIVNFTQRHPSLINKMRYSQDGTQIILHTKKSRELFIKMLDDAYLTSELTAQYYESSAKDAIEGEQNVDGDHEN